MDKKTIILKPTAFRKKMLMINDVLPGFLLLLNGLDAISGGESLHAKFAYLNIFTGIAVIAAFFYEIKKGNTSSHKLVSWFDVIAGLVLVVESLNKHHAGRIFQPALLYFILGLFVITRGLLHAKFPNPRRLIVDEQAFDLRVNLFIRLRMNWQEVESVDLQDKALLIKTKKGKVHSFNLGRVENKEEVLEGLRRQ